MRELAGDLSACLPSTAFVTPADQPGRRAAFAFRVAAEPPGAPAGTAREHGRPRGQFGHDRAALLGGQAGPARDFLGRAMAANADARLRVNHADLDAGALDLVALPDFMFPPRHPVRVVQAGRARPEG